jgi:pilus assembly protein CpaE
MALQILSAGRSKQELNILETLLHRQLGVIPSTRHICNGSSDPLQGIATKPDLLIINLSELWEEELKAVAKHPPALRPPVVVIGPANDVQIMRKSMQAGARDFLTRPVPEQELAELIQQVAKDQKAAANGSGCQLTAVMNAKGGAGGTVLSCNLAHLMTTEAKQKTMLLDLDIQFGVLPLYFDMHPQETLLSVLDRVEEIDPTALEGLVARHNSGLHLLGTMTDQLMLPNEILPDRLGLLIDLLVQGYQQVVVDLPRQIDLLTNLILERADRVMVVMQQSLTHIREVKRMLKVLTTDLGIPGEQITVVVNRYEAKSKIRLADVQEALGRIALEPIPNDFKHLENSINLGVPLRDASPHAVITRNLASLARKLSGTDYQKARRFKSVFGVFANFF